MPLCVEKKFTLSGPVQEFPCELILLRQGFGVLRHVIDRAYDINGTRLQPGDVTCALYWEDRPYTLYVWHLKRAGGTLYYFNIADSISLRPAEFCWRDLTLDILIDVRGCATLLDRHELPPNLDAGLAGSIRAAADHVMMHYRDIIQEVNGLLPDGCFGP
jgi:Protein of unknown function (DUF402)